MNEVIVSWNYINKGNYNQPFTGRAIIAGAVHIDVWYVPSAERFDCYVQPGAATIVHRDNFINRLKKYGRCL